MALDNDLILDFEKKTRYKLRTYLLEFQRFVENDYPGILNYYTGQQKVLPSEPIKVLRKLVRESEILDRVILNNTRRFQTTDFWDLLEFIEEIKVKLLGMINTPKWSRSSKTRAANSSQPKLDVQLGQNQTIERLAGRSLGSGDEHQDWYQIALENDAHEESYSAKGGKVLKVSSKGRASIDILSIVDIMDSETIKGKDLDKKITWENDDLKVLEPKDSFIQDADILLQLTKGDNPEFPNQGLSKGVAVGQNINSISYPVLVRQLSSVLSQDDSIESYSITTLERREDGLFIEVELESKGGELFQISRTF
jgi:hypothetical protein